MNRMACAALIAVGVTAGTAAVAAGEDPVRIAPLHFIPTENQSGRPLPAGAPARVRLSSPDLESLAGALGVKLSAGQASFEYLIGPYPQLPATTTRTWLEPTFVIDFNEPAFESLRKELDGRGPKLTRAKLVEYVADFIEGSDDRNWDIASVVAMRRVGDCSEHAVFTAALARLQGTPARVAIGIALVSEGEQLGAFGHAWTEVLENGKWEVADAALHGLDGTVRYLPLGLLEDEGMGYSMDLIRTMRIWIDRVVVLGVQ